MDFLGYIKKGFIMSCLLVKIRIKRRSARTTITKILNAIFVTLAKAISC